MNRIMYWLSYLIGDLLMFILPLIVLFIWIPVFNIKSLNMSASLCLVFVAFILHVPGNVVFVYTLSIFLKNLRIVKNIWYPILSVVSLFCNFITLNIVSFLVLEPWSNSNFYSPCWFTVRFTAWGMPFFLIFLFRCG